MSERTGPLLVAKIRRFAPLVRKLRFRVRTLIVLVALIALGFGYFQERENRRRYFGSVRQTAGNQKLADWSAQEAEFCRAAIKRGGPYDLSREDNNRSSVDTWFRSWQEELDWHQGAEREYRKRVDEY